METPRVEGLIDLSLSPLSLTLSPPSAFFLPSFRFFFFFFFFSFTLRRYITYGLACGLVTDWLVAALSCREWTSRRLTLLCAAVDCTAPPFPVPLSHVCITCLYMYVACFFFFFFYSLPARNTQKRHARDRPLRARSIISSFDRLARADPSLPDEARSREKALLSTPSFAPSGREAETRRPFWLASREARSRSYRGSMDAAPRTSWKNVILTQRDARLIAVLL